MSHVDPAPRPAPARPVGSTEPATAQRTDAPPAGATAATLDRATAAPAPSQTNSAWWQRNRMWVRLLIPLLLVALAATSFRIVRILIPIIDWSAPQVATGSELTFRQPVHVAPGKTVQREVTITLDSVREMTSVGAYLPDPGAHLYQVDLAFEAAPDVPLSGCYVFLRDAQGTLYGSTVGVHRDPRQTMGASLWQHCVPAKTHDPQFDAETGEVLPRPVDEAERPRNWSNYWAIAVPKNVHPTQVVVRWHNSQPEYAVLDIPR